MPEASLPDRDRQDAHPYAPFMREAIFLAKQGRWRTCPNPMVGAVLVKDGKIVARGWHQAVGLAHAEVECLKDAQRQGIDPAGATLVVTLEPCGHQGRTGPCSEALINARIGHLVYGMRDPNPLARGGIERMAEAGIAVTGPVLEAECRDLAADFLTWQSSPYPYLILKLAASLDGRIATRSGQSQWLSSVESRSRVHDMRRGIGLAKGAVLVGGNTFRMDNPLLTARILDAGQNEPNGNNLMGAQPLACILSRHLPKADAEYHLLNERPGQTIFFTSHEQACAGRAEDLRRRGVRVLGLDYAKDAQRADLKEMLRSLRETLGCHYVLCEGGGKLALSLMDASLVNELHLHLAPLILGDNNARALFDGRAPAILADGLRMRHCASEVVGGDIHLILRPEFEKNIQRAA